MLVNKWRTRRFILGLAFIFIMPALAAWYLFYYSDHRLLSFSNGGELISAPFQVSELALKNYAGEPMINKTHKWTLLYWTSECDESCKNVVDKLLRVRMVLGKDMLRTQAWLATDVKVEPNILERLTDPQGFNTQALLLSSQTKPRQLLADKHILLIDPSGNVMMRYNANDKPKSINSDLKQLLKLSRMG